jgi:hypothetical protein
LHLAGYFYNNNKRRKLWCYEMTPVLWADFACFKYVGYSPRSSHHCYDCNFKPKSIISYKIYRNVYVLSPCHISLNLAPVIFYLRKFQPVQSLALGYRTPLQFYAEKGNALLCTASGLAPVFLLVLVFLSSEMKRLWMRQVTSVWRRY